MPDLLRKYREEIGDKTADAIRRLVERSRMPRNKKTYEAGAVRLDFEKSGWKGPRDISMVEFFLARFESPYAEIGRFEYKDQQSVTNPSLLPEPLVERVKGKDIIYPVRIDIKDEIIRFYAGFLDKICEDTDDPQSYGQTVSEDVDIIVHIHDRLMSGKAIAESKLRNPEFADLIRENIGDAEKLVEILRDKQQEKRVILGARTLANGYGLNPDYAEELVRWMMDVTLRKVEVEYLRQRLGFKG